ncbi:MAG: signal peptide peptidase SppA [Burkholderiales bacterium]|nr:signal peptide peptidase SppA [Burkholderiales bacterium]
MTSRPGIVRRFFGGLWWLLDFSRRLVLNLLFLALVVVIVAAWWVGRQGPVLSEKTALVLNLSGDLVEQYTSGASEVFLAEALGEARRETQLRDVLQALDAAANDPKIVRVVLNLDDLSGGGLASLREVGAALNRFKKSGKDVVAWGSSFSQRQYFLAAHADEVYMHPMGSVTLTGIGGKSLYFKDALDKLGVTMHAFQAGKYKSAIEPLVRSEPSPEALEADQAWMDSYWAGWTNEVEAARKLDKGAIARLIDEAPRRLAAVRGDMGQLALKEKLVDALKTRDEFRALFIQRGAAQDEEEGTFRQISLFAYLSHITPKQGGAIGVVVAQGEILDDDAPQGLIGGRQTAELIRRAREDDDIKALVLRIDSPGGSAFGSELIRREIELTRKAGKPVVASMGDLAASGGYWITMSSDEVLADAGTITGSIGVFGVLPTFEKTLEKLGVGVGGASTSWLAAASSPATPMDKRLAEMVQTRIGHFYQQFIGLAAQARKTTPEKINDVAQGRVWTGQQAREVGLIDGIGGLNDALTRAAERAKLSGEFRVIYIERGPRGLERWLSLFMGRVAVAVEQSLGLQAPFLRDGMRLGQQAAPALRVFQGARDAPLRGYAYCFCAGIE